MRCEFLVTRIPVLRQWNSGWLRLFAIGFTPMSPKQSPLPTRLFSRRYRENSPTLRTLNVPVDDAPRLWHMSAVVQTFTSNIPPQPHRCIIIRQTDKTVYELKNDTLHRREPADVPREAARGLCAVAVSPVSRTTHLENVYYPPPRVSFDDLARYDDARDYFVVAQRTLLQCNDIDEPWGRAKRREPVSFAAHPSIADRY